jgi:hypothetical protein
MVHEPHCLRRPVPQSYSSGVTCRAPPGSITPSGTEMRRRSSVRIHSEAEKPKDGSAAGIGNTIVPFLNFCSLLRSEPCCPATQMLSVRLTRWELKDELRPNSPQQESQHRFSILPSSQPSPDTKQPAAPGPPAPSHSGHVWPSQAQKPIVPHEPDNRVPNPSLPAGGGLLTWAGAVARSVARPNPPEVGSKQIKFACA